MAIRFSNYAKIKDKYCICYFGPNQSFIDQLLYLRPILEKQFKGTSVFLCFLDKHVKEGNGKDAQVLKYSDLKTIKNDFAYIRELTFNMKDNPVLEFIKESEVDVPNDLFY
jgi:hypothetical protein